MVNVSIIGRLGADAEERTSQSGSKFLTLNLASDEYNKGERSTSWFRVTYIGDRAIKMKEYLTKGKLVEVHGTERVSLYTNKSGEAAISRDVMADRVDFVSVGSGQTQTTEVTTEAQPNIEIPRSMQPVAPAPAQATAPAPSAVAPSVTLDDDDDLPF